LPFPNQEQLDANQIAAFPPADTHVHFLSWQAEALTRQNLDGEQLVRTCCKDSEPEFKDKFLLTSSSSAFARLALSSAAVTLSWSCWKRK